MTPAELATLAKLMDRYSPVPAREVRDPALLQSLQRQGLAILGPAGWVATDAAAKAYVQAVCAEAGKADPWAESRDCTVDPHPKESAA